MPIVLSALGGLCGKYNAEHDPITCVLNVPFFVQVHRACY